MERTPGAVAVAWEGGELTYRQLDERADRLARRLRRLGVGPDALVGVCLERGPGLVVALLAALKAGGAYLPLDPDHPRDRLAGLLAGAGVAAVLTDRGLAGRLPPHPAPRLYLDGAGAAEEGDAGEAAAGPPGTATADNLAYVIYTSGSTGAPKGALNTHRGICNRLLWMQDALRLGGRRPGAAEDAAQLRRVGLGVLLAAAGRGPAGAGPARRPARQRLPCRADRGGGHHHRAFRAVDAGRLPGGAGAGPVPGPAAAWCAAARPCRRPWRPGCGSGCRGRHCTTCTGRRRRRWT